MNNKYTEIVGENIERHNLELPRSKSISDAIKNHPYCRLLEIRKSDNGDEIFIVILDLQIPSSPTVDVNEEEIVAVKCLHQDNDWPYVYVLRDDFPKGLTHTNAHANEYPVWICYTEENFEERKHHFTAFGLIEKIRKWFELTAIQEIHSDDQPLEPFFSPKGYAIFSLSDFPIEKDASFLSIQEINDRLIRILRENKSDHKVLCLSIFALPVPHGLIRKQPQNLKDLAEVITFQDLTLIDFIKNQFSNIHKETSEYKHIFNQKLGLICHIPRKRNKRDIKHEDVVSHLYITHLTISEIAVKLGIWEKTAEYYVPILNKEISLKSIEEIEVDFYSIVPDFDRKTAAFTNNINESNDTFALIGVGALGSQFLNNMGRMGFGKWLLIDHDIFMPHNTGRHLLSRHHVGYNKACSMANELNHLIGDTESKTFSFIDKNFLSLNDKDIQDAFKNVQAIIDMSTSIAVQRKIALDLPESIKAKRITSFLNPKGFDSVLLVEDSKRETRLDLLEMDYYRHLCNTHELSNHLEDNPERFRYASISCRDISSKISQENIALHTSIITKAIRKCLDSENGVIKIWRYDDETLTVNSYSFSPSTWSEFSYGGWRIAIDNLVLEELFDLRENKLPKETGGILIGAYDFEREIIYINNVFGATKDSEENNTTFLRGTDGLSEEVKRIKKVSNNEIDYVGEWHSHPNGFSLSPSNLDISFFVSLKKKLSNQGYPTLMFIVGDNRFNILISAENEF